MSSVRGDFSTQKLRNDAAAKGILIEDSKITIGLNDLPLYTPDNVMGS
jgi:hypothetical protein